MAKVMQNGQWLIIRLPKGRLREHAHTLGNLLFAQLQFAAMAREALSQRAAPYIHPAVRRGAEPRGERSRRVSSLNAASSASSVITANQFWEQLPEELRGALLSAGLPHLFPRQQRRRRHPGR